MERLGREMEEVAEMPEWSICHITGMPMNDPFIDETGNSYEKNAIYKWMKDNGDTSPITHQKISRCHLTPNLRLRDAIHDVVGKKNPRFFDNYEPSVPTEKCVSKHTRSQRIINDVTGVLGIPGIDNRMVERVYFTTSDQPSVGVMSLSTEREGNAQLFLTKYEQLSKAHKNISKYIDPIVFGLLLVVFGSLNILLLGYLPLWLYCILTIVMIPAYLFSVGVMGLFLHTSIGDDPTTVQ